MPIDSIAVCAPHHDAVLIEAPIAELQDTIATAQRLMADASEIVLDGFALRTSVRTAVAPARWCEPRGEVIWQAVRQALDASMTPAHRRHAT